MLQLSYIGAFVAILAVHFYGSELSDAVKLAIDMPACTWIVIVLIRRHNRAALLTRNESKLKH
jgi:hypothetical protein